VADFSSVAINGRAEPENRAVAWLRGLLVVCGLAELFGESRDALTRFVCVFIPPA
jgi:hypothetical protein